MSRIKEYPSITSLDGTNDALAIEQTVGANNRTRKVSPAQLKQYMEAGDFAATGEIEDGHGNKLKDMAKIADFAVNTWTPKIYDYNTYKRDAPAQKYVKIGDLYVMFMEGTFDFSDISTMISIVNLPCAICVGGTIFMGDLKSAAINTKGNRIQGDGKAAYLRPNVISSDLNTPASAPRNKFVFFGYDT